MMAARNVRGRETSPAPENSSRMEKSSLERAKFQYGGPATAAAAAAEGIFYDGELHQFI